MKTIETLQKIQSLFPYISGNTLDAARRMEEAVASRHEELAVLLEEQLIFTIKSDFFAAKSCGWEKSLAAAIRAKELMGIH